ncbi:hypothetical protein FHT76_006930 [Rhizobium sp. BK176]|nr:hypothetical protein [Rhizobium sp. BK181]MCS4095220.1 hypothetical protein [Rhizobium sp. BK176]
MGSRSTCRRIAAMAVASSRSRSNERRLAKDLKLKLEDFVDAQVVLVAMSQVFGAIQKKTRSPRSAISSMRHRANVSAIGRRPRSSARSYARR